jgi:NAD-dependent dihydropyrimidine dehydrogenase PreA subunit
MAGSTTTRHRYDVTINQSMCKECGYCKEVCRANVFEVSDLINDNGYRPMAVKHGEECTGCFRCLMACPDFAVDVRQAEA